eukprot:gene19157-29488_t
MAACGECAYLFQGPACPTAAHGRTGEVLLAAAYAFGYAFAVGMNYRAGVVLLLAVASSEASSTMLNLALQGDRPYWVEPSVVQVSCESNWGSLSPCVVAWAALSFTLANLFPSAPPALRGAVGCAVALFCGWTQTCQGTHWPSQVCASAVLGAFLAYACAVLLDRERGREDPGLAVLIGAVVLGVSLLLCLAGTAVLTRLGGDPDWALLAAGKACSKGWDGIVQVPLYASLFRPWAVCFASVLVRYWAPAPPAPSGAARVQLVARCKGVSGAASFLAGNAGVFAAALVAAVVLAAKIEAALDANYAEFMSWEAATSFKATGSSAGQTVEE